MRANPGGQVETKEIIGREQFIGNIWLILGGKSVDFGGERRHGKTCVIRKMCEEPAEGWTPVLMDLEGVHTAEEFAQQVSARVHGLLSLRRKAGRRLKDFLGACSGAEVGGVLKFPEISTRPPNYWKTLLESAVEDLVEQQGENRVVFFWDEMPYMIDAIAKRQGETVAMEVLDVCRALRQSPQTGSGFRMVLTGSLGLHHVLGRLKQQGYSNAPVNDMEPVDLPPLEQKDAEELARRLIEGENLKTADAASSARAIAVESGWIPFYIHVIVRELAVHGRAVDPADVAAVVQAQLIDPQDRFMLRHFRERINTYYPEDVKLVLSILDAVAAADRPQTVRKLFGAAKHVGPVDEERVRELLRLLQLDHYLGRDADGTFAFRSALLRRWWRYDRGLK